jgi:nucleotide-binding universal stress UspA family protein
MVRRQPGSSDEVIAVGDMIVVGNCPRTAITGAIADPTALHLEHHAPCDVVVVPAR